MYKLLDLAKSPWYTIYTSAFELQFPRLPTKHKVFNDLIYLGRLLENLTG